MNPPDNSLPTPLKTLTPELSASLRECADSALINILKSNCETQYFRESEHLSGFRAITLAVNWDPAAAYDDQDPLFEIFRKAVPLSSYPNYLPFISRLLKPTCKVSDIKNLLAPGLPEFIARSSGTSGGAFKYFPKYKHQIHPLPMGNTSLPRTTICLITSLKSLSFLDIVDGADGGIIVETIPVGSISVKLIRKFLEIDISEDAALMGQCVPSSNTSPHAISFIPSYSLCYLMHGLFAIANSSLSFIGVTFSTMFHDFIRLLDKNWDVLVQAIEDGQLPELGDLGNVKPYLQANMKANPDRAAELRSIDRKQEGWLKKIWPHLAVLSTISSGPYGAVVPKIRFYIGPSVSIHSTTYAATECQIGSGYDLRDLNLFKVEKGEYFEFLPIGRPESISELCQIWELTVGQKYEIVMTTQDGLWRYQLGDVVEIAGFDPVDGKPLIRYSERRHMGLRIAGEFISEKELHDAIDVLKGTLGRVPEFTMAVDERKIPRAYGFFVELEGVPGPNAHSALEELQSTLSDGNEAYKGFVATGHIGAPTIRVLAPGTFGSYREWKVQANGGGNGQIKVPTVLFDTETVDWLSKRVVHEI